MNPEGMTKSRSVEGAPKFKNATATHGSSGNSINGATESTAAAPEMPSVANPYNRAKDRVDAISNARTITINGVTMKYAYVSQRGFYPEEPFKANQDAYCVHENVTEDDAFFGVFDGHGKDGDGCAQFAKEDLPKRLFANLTEYKNKHPEQHLTREQVQFVLKKSHVETNQNLRKNPNVDDSLSGTTAVSIYFHGRRSRITISNVGDSRAVLGRYENSKTLKALPLSRDQTPYRKDERARIKKKGARVLSLDQLEGLEPIEGSEYGADNFELGQQIDEGGDPPRVWHPEEDYPGTAFTRSIGDALAEDLGVYAEPEMLTREINNDDKILVLASDGVYEFLTNQSVVDICAKFTDPLEACRAVVAEAYELWLQYELRTDDITIICIFIQNVKTDNRRVSLGAVSAAGSEQAVPGAPSSPIKHQAIEEEEEEDDDELENIDGTAPLLPDEGFKPVRKTVSKEKSMAIQKLKESGQAVVAEDEYVDLKQLATPKTPEEKLAIADAIKASTMFRNVTEEQRELVYSCMESIKVKAGQWVIRQGTVGDRFYIVDDGQFEVRIVPDGETDVTGTGGHILHQYEGSRERHAHPSFGELALMHSAPRSASIIAKTNGHLWALHRAAFRQILVTAQDHRKELKKVLRTIPVFEHLDNDCINKLAAIMEDITFGRGDNITEQGRPGTKMYVMETGLAYSTQMLPTETIRSNLKAGSYFGEEVLDGEKAYSKTIMAMQTTSCWQLDANVLKQTLGPLLQKTATSAEL